jgi:hypothetical protein
MRIFTYTRGDAESHKQLGKKLQELPEGNYVVTIKKNRPIRSLNANRYYHFMLNIIATYTGILHDDLHEAMKYKFNSKVIFFPQGGSQCIGNSTASLDTAEFASFVNKVKNYAITEIGVTIPEAKDVDYQKWMDVENEHDMAFNG